MSDIIIINNNRAESGPLSSVISALPEATVLGLSPFQQRGSPAQVLSFGLWWFNREFEERRPKLVIVLGDRYETLAAAYAAMFLRIPVAHIHGGETTAGAFDDAVRDAVTRLATVHFVATNEARERVFLLNGWSAWEDGFLRPVHLTGAPGLDGILPNSAHRDRKLILVTYHPETRAPDYGAANCRAMLKAVSSVLGYEVIFCGVNNDPGSAEIRAVIDAWLVNHGGVVREDISHDEYIRLMQSAALVIGNSSAIPIEAPWVGVPSVNVGDRQLGREMSPSVFQDDFDISAAIQAALSWNGPWAPCYKGEAAPRIAEVCREFVSGAADRRGDRLVEKGVGAGDAARG